MDKEQMLDNQKSKMREEITKELEKSFEYRKQADGRYEYTIYADYRDECSSSEAIKILEATDPMEAFVEKISDLYDEYSFDIYSDLKAYLKKQLQDAFPEGFTDEEDDLFESCLEDLVCIAYPYEHYLNQSFQVAVIVDTGDGNYDYTLNSVYPGYCGRKGEAINDKASIVWLSKQQGYTKKELREALYNGNDAKGFMGSIYDEVANIASCMQALTFLVEMTLKELIALNQLIRLQDRNGHQYDTTKNPYCGYVTLDKGTQTGLFDTWHGGGSLFEIELEKDVRLPIRFIRSALPDGGDGYSINEVYGFCGYVWTRGGVKKIHAPKNIA